MHLSVAAHTCMCKCTRAHGHMHMHATRLPSTAQVRREREMMMHEEMDWASSDLGEKQARVDRVTHSYTCTYTHVHIMHTCTHAHHNVHTMRAYDACTRCMHTKN